MTKDIEAALDPIGWQIVRRSSPALATILLSEIVGTPPVDTDTAARAKADRLNDTLRKVIGLMIDLQGLSDEERALVNYAAASLEAGSIFPQDIRDTVTDTQETLWRLAGGVEAVQAKLGDQGGDVRRGSPKVLRTHRVARAIAKVYLIGMGSTPTYWSPSGKDEPVKGPYGRAVEDVFDILGLGHDAGGPCRKAVASIREMTDGEFAILLALRCPVTRDEAKARIKLGL